MNIPDQQALLDWYIGLAQDPATKAYSWDRVKEMARDFPSVYGDLPTKLAAAMQAKTEDK